MKGDAPGNQVLPVDQHARQRALDVSISCAVSAPAGSGKTELLTQRLLALLAVVGQPEEILAITFTRKAAAEMRARLLAALALGEEALPPAQAHRRVTWELARRALSRDREQGWRLRDNPRRLRLQTIDSLCNAIASEQPVLSLLGGALQPVDDAEQLYSEAVASLLDELDLPGGTDASLHKLLEYYHGDLQGLSQLLGEMLARREQWLATIVQVANGDEVAAALQHCLQAWVAELLDAARTALRPWASGLAEVADFAASTLKAYPSLAPDSAIGTLSGITELPAASIDELPRWRGLLELLCTKAFAPRKSLTEKQGFPSNNSYPAPLRARSKELKQRLLAICAGIADDKSVLAAIACIDYLPDRAAASHEQSLLRALASCLVQLCGHLQLVFAQRRRCDHGEITVAALRVLGAGAAPSGDSYSHAGAAEQAGPGAYRWHRRLRHILVDEYQDTSIAQYRLLCALTGDWAQQNALGEEAARTLFLVGDAMQSIYAFRDARVQLFMRARQGALGDLPLEAIDLSQNFRSSPALVDWFNRLFAGAFPARPDLSRGAVAFSPAEAFASQAASETDAESCTDTPVHYTACVGERAAEIEAQHCVSVVQQALQASPQASIGILVRTRKELQHIMPALRAAGIDVQNSGVDLLLAREAVADCLSLARALLSSHDAIAWWALLRAPWCGLQLDQLQLLADHIQVCAHCDALPELLLGSGENGAPCESLDEALGEDTRKRLRFVASALGRAWQSRSRCSLRTSVEHCWQALGGPELVALSAQSEDAAAVEQFFDALETLEQEYSLRGDSLDGEHLQAHFAGLRTAFAEPGTAGVHAMTIYMAKGLEFDIVILPGLAALPGSDRHRLLQMGEHVFSDGSTGVLLQAKPGGFRQQHEADNAGDVSEAGDFEAPRPSGASGIYEFLHRERRLQNDYETTRLFYVAATRARQRLYLSAQMQARDPRAIPGTGEDLRPPPAASLLAKLWPSLQGDCEILHSPQGQSEGSAPRKAALDAVAPLLRRLDSDAIENLARRGLPVAALQKSELQKTSMQNAELQKAAMQSRAATGETAQASLQGGYELPCWQRAVGSCLHELLHLAICAGPSQWEALLDARLDANRRERLRQLGVQAADMDAAAARLQRSMQTALRGEHGAQLMRTAAEQACSELELLQRDGEGAVQRLRVDLSFVDAQKLRWLVDFKVAEPCAGQAVDDFFAQEAARYTEQLSAYARALAEVAGAGETGLRVALYFPLQDRILPISPH